MRKIIMALLLALICAAPATMPGCAFLQGQYENMHEMEQSRFDQLLVRITSMARIGGRELRQRLDGETRVKIVAGLDIILQQGTVEAFIKFIEKLKIIPEYNLYIIPALSTALDLVEITTGKPFTLNEHTHIRDIRLIRALFQGFRDGLTQNAGFLEPVIDSN